MDVYRGQLLSVLEAVHVDFPAAFLWFGKRYTSAPGELLHVLNEEQCASLLLLSLQDLLYRQFYCPGSVTCHAASWESTSSSYEAGPFLAALSDANSGTGAWDGGWHVCALQSRTVGLTKNGLTVYVSSELCRAEQSSRITLGARAALRQPNGSFNFSPGFYLARGEKPFEPATGGGILRLYWNIDPRGAADLVRVVTRRLNDARIGFQLKLLDDPRRYTRCDAAVLYLDKASYSAFSADHLHDIHARTAQYLRPDVPALTKKLCAGIGLAEEPRRDHSFGTDRCSVLAEGIISACRQHGRSPGDALTQIENRFRQSGIDPAAPYLNAGSRDVYKPIDLPVPRASSSPSRPSSRHALSDDGYLAAAHDIGRLIAATAIWRADECNWIGALGPSSLGSAPRIGSLGPDLYDGTAGIALFLGRLFTVTRDRTLRNVALGAIRHSIAEIDRAGSAQDGLYVGTLGVALVAAQLGLLLDIEGLLNEARRLAAIEPAADIGFDLIAGTAGRIIGHLAVADVLQDTLNLDASFAAGWQLVAAAVRSDRGASWSTRTNPRGRHLTGLSHGTAGAALSLLELFAVSGEDQFKDTAEAAFDYERSFFDRRYCNWPDLREVDGDGDERSANVPFSITWCHGAPGIALSRIRAAEVLASEAYASEARIALRTTGKHLRTWLESGRANYSLCHGVAGNADVLLSAVRSGVRLDFGVEEAIAAAAEFGLKAYGGSPSHWPCGAGGGGANPSLMVGWAGIGHFYLRLTQKHLPTPLAPRDVSTTS